MFLRRAKIAAPADRQRPELVLYRRCPPERGSPARLNLRDDAIARDEAWEPPSRANLSSSSHSEHVSPPNAPPASLLCHQEGKFPRVGGCWIAPFLARPGSRASTAKSTSEEYILRAQQSEAVIVRRKTTAASTYPLSRSPYFSVDRERAYV